MTSMTRTMGAYYSWKIEIAWKWLGTVEDDSEGLKKLNWNWKIGFFTNFPSFRRYYFTVDMLQYRNAEDLWREKEIRYFTAGALGPGQA